MLCGGISPQCLAARHPAASRAGLTAHLSPVSWHRRCRHCQLVSHSTGESGCGIPGAQESRSQDRQRLQQQTSKAGQVQGGWGASPAKSRVGTCRPASPRGVEGTEAPRCAPDGCWFPFEQAGGLGRSTPERGGWGGGFTTLLWDGCSLPSAASAILKLGHHHRASSTVHKQLPECPAGLCAAQRGQSGQETRAAC